MLISVVTRKAMLIRHIVDRRISPLALLTARLLVAKVFLVSGWLKLGYVLHDQLDTLYFLFEDYKVPILSTKVAAWMGMMGELGFSSLLALGLFGRVGALGLMFMSGVIYSTDHNPLAAYWASICFIIATHGAGRLSLDVLIFKDKVAPATAINTSEGNFCSVIGGFNYCRFSKIMVSIALFPMMAWIVSSFFSSIMCKFLASALVIGGLIGAAIWIDHLPILSGKIPALIGRRSKDNNGEQS